MPVVSPLFIGFVILVGIAVFVIPKARWQEDVLLLASLFFYASYGPEYLIFVLMVAGLSYFGAMRIGVIFDDTAKRTKGSELSKPAKQELKEKNTKKRKMVKTLVIIFIMTVWALGKTIASFEETGFILPLGISYYSFTATGYLIDVNRGKYKPEPRFGKYLLFITYFPHIIQGPFSRYDELAPSLFEVHRFNWERVSSGACRVIWGFAKKAIVADQLSYCVTRVLENPTDYHGCQIVISMLLYGIQLYADFSGYMDIMCGVSQIYGIKLAENFRQPYFAGSVEEFWRRWHITLGTWFKDYVFYPISLSHTAQKIGKAARTKYGPKLGKLAPSYFAMIFVWTLTGFWHGANWNQIIWGWLNLIVIVVGMTVGENKLPRWAQVIHTYLLVTLLRSFSSVSTLSQTAALFKQTLTHFDPMVVLRSPVYAFPGLKNGNIVAVIIGIIAITAVDILSEQGKWEQLRDGCPVILKSLVMAVLLIAIVLFAGNGVDLTGTFMYANF